jgi:putative ABC transport system permease protein
MRSLYAKLALVGIRKNGKIYLPYILTCIGMVMMYYLVSYLAYSKAVYAMSGGRDLQMILSWGTGVIAVFAVIFLFYSSSFIIRRRKKEFGLYNILGMDKRNIASILIWETLMVCIIALGAGIGLGILFSKLLEECTAKLLGSAVVLGFSIEPEAIKNTLLVFCMAFVLILLHALTQIRLSQPIALLHSEHAGERPPKARFLMALVGAGLLIAAYYISCTIQDPLAALLMFFVAVIMVIAATYLLFTVGSVALCKVLQMNKKFYYHTAHFVSVSSMSYRMKRNGASLASICILSTMVLVMVSSTLCLYVGLEDSLNVHYPRDIECTTSSIDEAYTSAVHETIRQVLEERQLEPQNTLSYQWLPLSGILEGSTIFLDYSQYKQLDTSKLCVLYVLSLEEYNRLTGESRTLSDDEVLIYAGETGICDSIFTIDGLKDFQIMDYVDAPIFEDMDVISIIPSIFMFVSDTEQLMEIDQYQRIVYGENFSDFEDCYSFDLDCSDEEQLAVRKDLVAALALLQEQDDAFPNVASDWKASERLTLYSTFSGLLFLAILLSIVFICATVLIMYYKQITEGYEDAGRFEIMQKVGMTETEIRQSINSQILLVFFAPLLMAGLHVCFAFPIIYKLLNLFGIMNRPLLIQTSAGAFLVFACLYRLVYKITSRSYYHIVKN